MKLLKTITISVIFISLFSCDTPSEKASKLVLVEKVNKNDSIATETQENPTITNTEVTFLDTDSSVNTTIHFNEFSLTIHEFIIYDELNKLAKTQQDTVSIYAELSESVEGQFISISKNQLTGITIEQCYETSITIMAEGPHCDLTDWKHYISDWKPLKVAKSGYFSCIEYAEKDREKFIPISMEDLKKEVKATCGDGWAKLLSKSKSPNEYPSGVSISRYFLKITGKTKGGQTRSKLIIIEVPMGC